MQTNSILNTQKYYRLVGLMNKNKYYQSDMFDLIINQIKYLTNPPNYDLRESYINNNPFNINIFTNEALNHKTTEIIILFICFNIFIRIFIVLIIFNIFIIFIINS